MYSGRQVNTKWIPRGVNTHVMYPQLVLIIILFYIVVPPTWVLLMREIVLIYIQGKLLGSAEILLSCVFPSWELRYLQLAYKDDRQIAT